MRRLLLGFVLTVTVAGCASQSTPPPSSSPASNPPTASPSLVPSAVAATAKPTSSPAAKPTAVCLATELSAKVTSWQGAAGHRIASVTLKNTSAHTCIVQGTPEVELVDAHGAILIDSQTSGAAGLPHIAKGAPAFRLAHGATLTTLVQDGNYCGAAPALPTTIAFVFPSNAGRLVAARGPGGSVPPCNGSPGSLGSIEMNGWKK